jgi:hypothetical protein
MGEICYPGKLLPVKVALSLLTAAIVGRPASDGPNERIEIYLYPANCILHPYS